MVTRTVITTLVTAATAPSGGQIYDLTDLTTVKADLGVTDNANNAFFKSLISRASAAAASYCNRVFPVETITDEFLAGNHAVHQRTIPDRCYPLQLTRFPVTTLTSVVENAVTLVDGTDFRLDKDKGQLIRLGTDGHLKSWSMLAVTITYAAGYAPIPYDVVDAVIRMIKNRWFMRTRDSTLRQQNVPGVLEQTFWIATGAEAGAMTPDVVDLLDGYRVPVVTA